MAQSLTHSGPEKGAAARRVQVAFVSSNETPWGGSEELWARTALILAGRGHAVSVYKPNVPHDNPQIRALIAAGCRVVDLNRVWPLRGRLSNMAARAFRAVSMAYHLVMFWIWTRARRPDFVILSQGGTWDGFQYAQLLRRAGIRFATISQKATDLYWPPDFLRDSIAGGYEAATASFFVSEHNRRLTEEQIAAPIRNAVVVRNPFLVDWAIPVRSDWPEPGAVVRFACVGRLYAMEKGQDLLLRVLAWDKWRARPLTVTFFGEGMHERGLQEMARFLGLSNVTFAGQTSEVPEIWNQHHALLLPSRAEGLPLVLVETMLSGRVAIITDAGGSAEMFEDGESGFLPAAATEASLDEAMERAWQRLGDWPAIGAAAACEVRKRVPQNPAADLADRIEPLFHADTDTDASRA